MWLGNQKNHEAIEKEVRTSLEELRDISIRDGIKLTVLVLPLFTPHEEWTVEEKASRIKAIQFLEDLGIRHFDLLDTLKDAIVSGITLGEQPGDTWHPSEEVSKLFADTLFVEGIFQGKES